MWRSRGGQHFLTSWSPRLVAISTPHFGRPDAEGDARTRRILRQVSHRLPRGIPASRAIRFAGRALHKPAKDHGWSAWEWRLRSATTCW